jgi:lipoate-protein ligase A
MTTWRLLDTGALPASLNMAIDEALLKLHAKGESPPTLRLYQWDPPAVSLGALQRQPGFDVGACRRLGLDVVRRPTGGRAVLHQNDLTYSVFWFGKVYRSLPDAYRLLCGLLPDFTGSALSRTGAKSSTDQPGVCFLRSLMGDVAYPGNSWGVPRHGRSHHCCSTAPSSSNRRWKPGSSCWGRTQKHSENTERISRDV